MSDLPAVVWSVADRLLRLNTYWDDDDAASRYRLFTTGSSSSSSSSSSTACSNREAPWKHVIRHVMSFTSGRLTTVMWSACSQEKTPRRDKQSKNNNKVQRPAAPVAACCRRPLDFDFSSTLPRSDWDLFQHNKLTITIIIVNIFRPKAAQEQRKIHNKP